VAPAIPFLKYEGCGNDFLIIDERRKRRTSDEERRRWAPWLCDRHFGVGADGVLFLDGTREADAAMHLIEPDGVEALMCGNGLRCVGAHLLGQTRRPKVTVLTQDGPKTVERRGSGYRAALGPIRSDDALRERFVRGAEWREPPLGKLRVTIPGRGATEALFLFSGEPHLIIQTEALAEEDLDSLGQATTHNTALFPEHINVNLLEARGPHEVAIRTYERGVFAETLACGTGATAAAYAARLLDLVREGPISVIARGGTLEIEFLAEEAYMSGPARCAFEGVFTPPARAPAER